MLSKIHNKRLVQMVHRYNSTTRAELNDLVGEYTRNRKAYFQNNKFFKHPLDSKYHPINFSPVRFAELYMDVIGPEPVSPHYEPFSIARQFALNAIFALGFTSYFMKISDLNWALESTYMGLFYYSLQYFVYFEAIKYLML